MTDFDKQYKRYADRIEESLPGYFQIDGPLPAPVLADAMAYSLLGGGKRLRGVLLLACCRLFREDVASALPFAAALEMVHTYSLIHDDLPCMDNDDMRRGKPACHIAFGEAAALLAGDALLTLAFEAMTAARGFPAETVLRAVNLLAFQAGMTGMIAGQVLDLAGEGKALTTEELDDINVRKTGRLISAAAGIGCILGGATAEQERSVTDYAMLVAWAFQIVDDILDETADPAVLGKPVGSDRGNNKTTYMTLYGMEECRRKVKVLTGSAKEQLRKTGLDSAFLCGLADWLQSRAY